LIGATFAVSCKDNPCLNGCVCQQSCRDENDYYCENPNTNGIHQHYIGKNCEYPVIATCRDTSIELVVPENAIKAYQLTVPNGVVCGGAVKPDFFCPRPSITTTTEKMLPTGEKHMVIRADCSSFVNAGGNFFCQDTFVMDRDDALIAMPIPIVSIRCEMRTEGVIGVINPQIRQPNTFDSELIWQPRIEFFKTEFGHPTPIRVPAMNPLNGYGYIVGETIHVVVTGLISGSVPMTPYTVDVNYCHIVDQNNGASVVSLIENGVPVVTHTPVHVEPTGNQRVTGIIGGAGPQGAAFNFQVFTYRSGAKLKMNCGATFTPLSMGRRRRSAVETTEFSVPVIFYEVGSEENEDDIPIIEIHEEFDEIVEPINLDNGVEISPYETDKLIAGMESECDGTILCLGPLWLEITALTLLVLFAISLLRCVAMVFFPDLYFGSGKLEALDDSNDNIKIQRKNLNSSNSMTKLLQ